jgi:hypothetical protein
MPNRILKESICKSESLEKLSWFERVVFFHLIVICDDYGRTDARPGVLKGSMFPLNHVTCGQIIRAIEKLQSVGIVTFYEADGGTYLQICNWDKHQNVRTKRGKFPPPPMQHERGEGSVRALERGGTGVPTQELDGAGAPLAGEPLAGEPTYDEVVRCFLAYKLDAPFSEAQLFLAYNEKRGWDCLPNWRAAAELWALRYTQRQDDAQ